MGTIYAFCWRCQREGGDVICNDCTIHSAHARHMYVFFTMCDVCFNAYNDFYSFSPV